MIDFYERTNSTVIASLATLQAAVSTMDGLSQEAFTTIAAAARGALQRMDGLGSGPYLATALGAILWAAEDAENRINSEAENVGCNHSRHERRGSAG